MIPAIKWLNPAEGSAQHSDKLFVLDSDSYTLYGVREDAKSGQCNVHPLNSCPTSLPGTKQEQDLVRSFALDYSSDNHLAIGFSSGRISILPADVDPGTKYIRGEEIREAQKSITFLEWNPLDSNRLCAAYERGRGADHAVVVYDLGRTLRSGREIPMPVTIFEANFTEKVFGISWFKEDPNLLLISATRTLRIADIREHGNFNSTLTVPNPLLGVASEPINGYRFACHSRNTVLLYDRRLLGTPLHEVEACASTKIINKLGWHPRRDFQLTAIAKDSANLFQLSISPRAFQSPQNIATGSMGGDSSLYSHQVDVLKSELTTNTGDEYCYAIHPYSVAGTPKLAAFDWHPSVSQRLALLPAHESKLSTTGGPPSASAVDDLYIINLREGVCSDIGACGELALIGAQTVRICSIERQLSVEKTKLKCSNDVASTFKRRIEAGYGYGNTLSPFSTLIEHSKRAIDMDETASEGLKFCWRWIWMMFQSSDANETQKNYGTMFIGVKKITQELKSTSQIKGDDITFRNRVFLNEKRLKIQKMCNWPNHADREECKTRFDEMVERDGLHGITRAAALALFSVQGSLSKEYLVRLSEFTHSREFTEAGHPPEFVTLYQRMADTVLHVVQKYDGVRVPDYEIVCEELVRDAYLIAIVKFLARRDKIYNKMYNEIFDSKILLEDKLGFAAMHMDDELMATALDKLAEELHEESPLSALLVVGLDDQPETHLTLRRYLDLTGDLQTISILLIIGNCFHKCKTIQDVSMVGSKATEFLATAIESESRSNPRRLSLHCLRDYFELLNRWKFWLAKTFLSLFLRPKITPSEMDSRSKMMSLQAVIACSFCGSPIYPTISEKIESLRLHTPKINYSRRSGANSRTRTMSCMCRKPLPKCVICRKHLGSQMETEASADLRLVPSSAIDHWIVWCGGCNHGGHLAHLRDWFGEYSVCASSGCHCNCVQRDHKLRDELYANATEAGEGR